MDYRFLNVTFSPFASAVIVIVFVHAAYIGEAFRSGILAINNTQTEAARSLGMTKFQTLRYVIIPQAFKLVLPTLANQWTGIIKDTAICTILAITELLKAAQIISTWESKSYAIGDEYGDVFNYLTATYFNNHEA